VIGPSLLGCYHSISIDADSRYALGYGYFIATYFQSGLRLLIKKA
jgi:hypothetical protein